MYSREELNNMGIHSLRVILRADFKGVPGTHNKKELINQILMIQSGEEIPMRSTKGRKPLESPVVGFGKEIVFFDSDQANGENGFITGYFERSSGGYGYVRPEDFSFKDNGVFVRETFVKRAGLKTGDFISGEYEGYGDRGGKILKSDAFINGKMVSASHEEPLSLKVKPVRHKINLASEQDYLINSIDAFCPIGKGQRCLVFSEDDGYATTLFERILSVVQTNEKDFTTTFLLVGAKPEKVEELKSTFKSEVVSVDFNEDLEIGVRICNLVAESVKTKVKNGANHLLIIDKLSSILRIFREYVKGANQSDYISDDLSAEKFIVNLFGSGGYFDEQRSLTVIASVGDLQEEFCKTLVDISHSVIKLKGEGKVRKRSFRLDLKNSWTDNDDVLHGEEKIALIDEIREEICSSQDKEDEVWTKIKNKETKF